MTVPEILAPAGDPLALRAAIAAGADAVYLGMTRFNARGRAERFRGVALDACVRTARAHGVRVYVTLNTLLHDDELPVAVSLAREARDAGAAAAIVQDLGFASLLRAEIPDLPVHGSTQMTIHQPEQAAELVQAGGLTRIILARECSVSEARAVADRVRPLGADVEVFVHGALCFAYSGQCLMSNFAGRRSANRGICAQNCRFDFTAGDKHPGFRELPLFDRRRASQLISMKDLAAFESVAALADAGIASFKIEGRLKGPEYVAEVVRLYRAAIDAWRGGRSFDARDAEREAGRVFSRGFTNGYLSGVRETSMRGDKRSLEGEADAVVRAADRRRGMVRLEPRAGHAIRPGQGYRYAHDRYRGGFLVLAARQVGAVWEATVRFGADAAGRRHRRGAAGRRRPPPPLPAGLACYLNSDPELASRIDALVASVELKAEPEPVPLTIIAAGAAGEPLRIRAVAGDGRAVERMSATRLEAARSRELGEAVLADHLGRLGGTAFRLQTVDASGVAPGAFLSFPSLHALRNDIVAALGEQSQPAPATRPGAPRERALAPDSQPPRQAALRTSLGVCAGTPEALAAARLAGADRIVAESASLAGGMELDGWREAAHGVQVWLRVPPIAHDPRADEASLEAVGRLGWSGIIAGHMGQVRRARELGIAVAADLYLNAYNVLTLAALRRAGAIRVTLSLEVDAREARRVAERARDEVGVEVEVVAGGRVFSMLTRQSYGLDGGERMEATSEHGHGYVLAADADITTLYEARELLGVDVLPDLAGAAGSVRLDLAHHPAQAVGEITAAYRRVLDALARAAPGAVVVQDALYTARSVHLRHAPHGAFTGHLLRGSRSLDVQPEAGKKTGSSQKRQN